MNTNHTPKNDRTAHLALAQAAQLNNGWKVGHNFAKSIPIAKVSLWDKFKKANAK